MLLYNYIDMYVKDIEFGVIVLDKESVILKEFLVIVFVDG